MREFAWTSSDVVEWLQGLKDNVSQDERPVPLPLLFEKLGRYRLNKGIHHSICFLWRKNELLDRDIDRKMREEVQTNPLMKPQEAHEKGQQLALQMAQSAGETGKEHDSIAIVFQSWHEVRNSYYRRRKQAAITVSNPFKPPDIYSQTYRAFVMQCEEKWLSLAEQKTGVIMFASDDDCKAAAECDLLMAPSIFVPKAFRRFTSYMDCSYAVIFEELKRRWNELSVKPNFQAFHCDYEEAEMSAAEDAFTTKTIPTQINGSDCGVFLCRFAECIARDADTDFNAADMNEFRKKIFQGIKSGKLI